MLLLCMIFAPFFGGLLCWQSYRLNSNAPRWIALISTTILFFLSIFLILRIKIPEQNIIQPLPIWYIEYFISWIPRFGINFHLAIDGLSLIMVTLTGFIGILSVLCSWRDKHKKNGLFYLNLLFVIGNIVGIFLSVDMFLFFFFWEIMIIPVYFLVVLWGNKSSKKKVRISSAIKFYIYNQISGLLMLSSIIILVLINYKSTGIFTFDYKNLLLTSMPYNIEYLIMLGFFLAFAIKLPIIPFHGWLIDFHSQSSTSGSIDISSVLLKTSFYGMLRFVLPLCPHASYNFSQIAIFIGIIGIFYGSFMAYSQTNIKKLIAYSSLSHMGFILIAIYSNNKLAYCGAIIQMIAHALSTAGLFIIFGQLYDKLNTFNINKMGGLWKQINFIPAVSLFFFIALLGIPGTLNFIGEITILFGSFAKNPLLISISTFSLVLSSIYLLIAFKKIYYGPIKLVCSSTLTIRERLITFIIVVLLVVFGIFPNLIINQFICSISNIYYWFNIANSI